MTTSVKQWLFVLGLFIVLFQVSDIRAQDLEPRRWSHLPSGLNLIGAGLANSSGDIAFDRVLLIENGKFDLAGAGISYLRTFGLLGKSARVDVVAPFANGRWEGLLNGVDTVVRRRGMADPWVRFSVNLYGAPALKGTDFQQFRASHPSNTTIGAAVSVTMPLGEYNEDHLINLGNNRWVFGPQLGLLHQREKWQFELTGTVFVYGANRDFWKSSERKQDPSWFLQSHVIYSFKPGWWAGISTGYLYGGENRINDVSKHDDARALQMAVSLGTVIGKNQALKLSYVRSRTHVSTGIDADALMLGWSCSWFD